MFSICRVTVQQANVATETPSASCSGGPPVQTRPTFATVRMRSEIRHWVATVDLTDRTTSHARSSWCFNSFLPATEALITISWYSSRRIIPILKRNTIFLLNFSNAKCGRLHCLHDNEKPAFAPSALRQYQYSYFKISNTQITQCRVARFDLPKDPGMVPDGAGCGINKVRELSGSGKV